MIYVITVVVAYMAAAGYWAYIKERDKDNKACCLHDITAFVLIIGPMFWPVTLPVGGTFVLVKYLLEKDRKENE